jgi:predicted phage terminase large subunit-like protein
MQRLHQNDPTGYQLENSKDTIKHICLPGEIENYRDMVSPPELIKNYKNNLLDPNRFDWKTLEKMKAKFGQYGYAGQIGQNPVPADGGMFKTDHFQFTNRDTINKTQTVRYWDKAGTVGNGAFTAGVKISRLNNGRFMIEDVKRGQWATEEREQIIRETAEADGANTIVVVEQEPGSGGKESAQGTIRNLAGYSCYADRPTGDKTFRADPYSVQVNNGNVTLMTGIWNRDFIEEHTYFPLSTYKDQVDAAAGAFNYLAGKRVARRIT